MLKRPDWDQYFLNIANEVKKRSPCLKAQYGAVIVKDNLILSIGYNGPPKGEKHCDKLGGCLRPNAKHGEAYEKCRGIHAEMNALIFAAINGVSIKGSKIYVTGKPCNICVKLLKQAEVEIIGSSPEDFFTN